MNEKGFTGHKAQRAHMELGKRRRAWHNLEPPVHPAGITVLDVVNAPAGDEQDEMIRRWSRAVWESWGHVHEWVKEIAEEVIG